MTVTPEQWALVAADNGLTPDELRAKIAEIDRIDTPKSQAIIDLGPTMFDRQLDPLTLGEWSILYGSKSYRFIADTILPNGYRVATIWQGINEDLDEPPVVMESAVFRLGHEGDRLGTPLVNPLHATEEEALAVHTQLTIEWGTKRAAT